MALNFLGSPVNDEDKKAFENIKDYGCHILNVMEDEHGPSFSYSIGIQQCLGKPELLVHGLNQELAQAMINDYNFRLKEGEEFIPGKYYDDFLEGFKVCFTEVDLKFYDDYFGWGKWLYKGTDFKVLQLIWPTTEGLWPWDEHGSEYYSWSQPILNSSQCITKI